MPPPHFPVLQPRSHGVVQDNIFIDNTQWAAEISLETLARPHFNSEDPPSFVKPGFVGGEGRGRKWCLLATEVHGNRFFSPSTDPPISDSRVVMRFGARNDIRTESRTVKELPIRAPPPL